MKFIVLRGEVVGLRRQVARPALAWRPRVDCRAESTPPDWIEARFWSNPSVPVDIVQDRPKTGEESRPWESENPGQAGDHRSRSRPSSVWAILRRNGIDPVGCRESPSSPRPALSQRCLRPQTYGKSRAIAWEMPTKRCAWCLVNWVMRQPTDERTKRNCDVSGHQRMMCRDIVEAHPSVCGWWSRFGSNVRRWARNVGERETPMIVPFGFRQLEEGRAQIARVNCSVEVRLLRRCHHHQPRYRAKWSDKKHR